MLKHRALTPGNHALDPGMHLLSCCILVKANQECMVSSLDYSSEPIRKGIVSKLCAVKNDLTLFTRGTRTHIKNYLVLNLDSVKFQTH